MESTERLVYTRAIREALANGNAAVMIGSGFSRNAEGGHQMMTWKDLGSQLWDALNPGTEQDPSISVMQLAEQYEEVFTRPYLDELLKRCIPDNNVVPGAIHDQLLQLPWVEIFTTNYDTLLERAADRIIDRAFYTVCTREDIPQSKILDRHRIVKLHGSFPSQRPFIFTESDYRRYPKDFAPFVNLVRQSLLENVFCLFGFSGTDPNFLNWIGWVRDMLDKHSLPIYLFLDKEPSFGELKVLKTRHVIPVLLPIGPTDNPDDYEAKFKRLFKELKEPLEENEKTWGKFTGTYISHETSAEDKFEAFIRASIALNQERQKYPGWLVAPQKIRQQLKSSIENSIHFFLGTWFFEKLKAISSAQALLLMSQYVWQREVQLQPIEDEYLEVIKILLESSVNLKWASLSSIDVEFLKKFGCTNQKTFDSHWIFLALNALKSVRQQLDENSFNNINNLIRKSGVKKSNWIDDLSYEEILLSLYQGKRTNGRKLLINWIPLALNPFNFVKRGALVAELIDKVEGMQICLKAIQEIRWNQKIAPKNNLLLSQEAWACVLADYIEASIKYDIQIKPAKPEEFQEDDLDLEKKTQGNKPYTIIPENINDRLSDLASLGHEVKKELESIHSNVDSQASPPSEPKLQFADFDLGHISFKEIYGSSYELSKKIKASFEWLELADRVALIPRVNTGGTFDLDTYVQSAWWIQYADSNARMISVLLRTLQMSALDAKNEHKPLHQSGWFSRVKIANLSSEFAEELASQLLTETEQTLASNLAENEVLLVCKCYVEIFSRLMVRITQQETIITFTKRLISLFVAGPLHTQPTLWEGFTVALSRCLEALPVVEQLKLIPTILQIPLIPHVVIRDYFFKDWIELYKLFPWIPPKAAQFSIPGTTSDEIIKGFCERLSDTKLIEAERTKIWGRVIWMNVQGMLSDFSKEKLTKLIWSNVDGWPQIPGFYDSVVLSLTYPSGDIQKKYRQSILKLKISVLGTPKTQPVVGKLVRSYSFPVNNNFLISTLASVSDETWPIKEFEKFIWSLRAWWDEESNSLKLDMPGNENVRQAVFSRFELIDRIFGAQFKNKTPKLSTIKKDCLNWLLSWVSETEKFGSNFWRFKLRYAQLIKKFSLLKDIEMQLTLSLFSATNEYTRNTPDKTIKYWLVLEDNASSYRPALLISSLISVVTSRHMPALGDALHLLRLMVKYKFDWLKKDDFELINLGLTSLLNELDYFRSVEVSDIPEEDIPLLRFRCAGLCLTLNELNIKKTKAISTKWLEAAAADPLAEMRLERYKTVSD